MGTRTAHFEFYKPTQGEVGWDDEVSDNFQRLEDRITDLGINPKAAKYDCQFDGVTLDTAGLHDAIADSEAEQIPLAFPAGTTLIDDPLDLTLFGGQVRGSGFGRVSPATGTVIQAAAASGLDYMVRLGGQRPALSGITLDGNSTAKVGWLLHNAKNAHLEHLAASFCTEYGYEFRDNPAGFPQGNNNAAVLTKCDANSNLGVGIGMRARGTDNNAITLDSCDSSVNGSHGFELIGFNTQMQSGKAEANGGYGIKVGEIGDSGASVGIILFFPYLEGNKGGTGAVADQYGVLFTAASQCWFFKANPAQSHDHTHANADNRNVIIRTDGSSGLFTIERSGLDAAGGRRTIEFNSAGFTLGGGSDTNRDALITTKGTGRLKPSGGLWIPGDSELDGAFNHDGTTFGALGATPATQRVHVVDPSGGATQDAEARAAINAILVSLETFGFHASS